MTLKVSYNYGDITLKFSGSGRVLSKDEARELGHYLLDPYSVSVNFDTKPSPPVTRSEEVGSIKTNRGK